MNILVTGGSGFIGSHFIEEFLKRDDVTNYTIWMQIHMWLIKLYRLIKIADIRS